MLTPLFFIGFDFWAEKNFFRYIKVTSDDTAKAISGDIFFRK